MKHVESEKGGYFASEKEGREEGRMSYVKSVDKVMIIDHTNVSPESQGSGVGTQLVGAAVEYARTSGHRIKATCPFARAVLVKHQEWQDVMVV